MAAGDPTAVTLTGAAWVVTWKFPLVGLTAYKVAVAKAAAEEGHTGDPPPAAEVMAVGAVNTTRWKGASVPTAAVTTLAVAHVVTALETAVVTKKAFGVGARAYSTVETRAAAFAGHAVGVEPEPTTAVGAGAVKVRTCPDVRVPTAAVTTPLAIAVTGTADGKVDTMKLLACGKAAKRAAPAIAAALTGQDTVPPPLSVVVLPDWVKKSSVPAVSVPTAAVIAWVEMAVTEMPDTLEPTTQ